MAKILIIRFSALGDVAMTIPVIYSLAVAYPTLEITVLSRQSFQPLFANLPGNVRFMRADLSGTHEGLSGLNALFQELRKNSYDYVADFHSILRSNYLRFRFQLAGIPTAAINKERAEKKKLTRKRNKELVPLKSSFTRYYEVLEKLGFQFPLQFETIIPVKSVDYLSELKPLTGDKGDQKWLGIAPFAKHMGKVYPEELQIQVIKHFANDIRVKVFVFGGGDAEKKIVDVWASKYPSITSMVGKLRMNDELLLMSQLDLMYSMDSGNMHLASLVNTPVVSVWGATHPFAGFMGWNQSIENAVQVDLECRPCSVYGQKPCYRGDYACLYSITPKMIIDRIEKNLF
jgi:ADP-heptose:LPS heptosyltransferase